MESVQYLIIRRTKELYLSVLSNEELWTVPQINKYLILESYHLKSKKTLFFSLL